MPLYNLASREALEPKTREAVAQAVTRAHCAVTGAPAEFVNVMFVHGHALARGNTISAIGGVRKGGTRTPEVVERLRTALQEAVAQASGNAIERVEITLIGIASNWVMEGGEIMPDPGAEAEWLARRAGDR